MLVVFGLIAVLFVIGFLVVKRDQKRADERRAAEVLRLECEDREFERKAAKAASLAALQRTVNDIRAERAAKIEAAGLVPAVPPTGTPERRMPRSLPKKKAKKGRGR
ncbi:MAG TPA: hypothetical protein VNR65_04645 [Geobacterales bacterium]|nr:hypothetical protein [Geobacterales bacterium]